MIRLCGPVSCCAGEILSPGGLFIPPPLCYAVCEVIDMNLGENIRRSRLERGLTQSALAEALGVSDRAVSRWERNDSLPDVTLLAQLALVLDTSADALLAVDPQRMQAEILAATEEATALLRQDKPGEAVALLREKSARCPNQPELMVYLARALMTSNEETSAQEALALCRAAEQSAKPMRLSTTYGCKQVMALCLHRLGRSDEAVRLVTDEMPAIFVSRELMLARVSPPEHARRIREHNVTLLGELMLNQLDKLAQDDATWAMKADILRQIFADHL